MKKIITILMAVIIVGIVSSSMAFAYNGRFGTQTSEIRTNYQGMQNIMINGTYSDLVDYRETTGFNVMPWVQDESDFNLAQQMHSRMIQWRQNNNVLYNQGFGRSGGCHMMNNRVWN